MTRPLRIDTAKAGALAAQALEESPALRDELARHEGDGQHWRIRADLVPRYGETPGDVQEWVALSAVFAPDAALVLWFGPRELVELPEPGRGVH